VNADEAVRVEGLGRRYGRVWALRGCTLSLPAGRVIALVGPNGAGKTTLLRLVVGLLSPSQGAVEVFGESPAANTPAALARVGFVAQEHPLYRRFSVADLLRMGRHMNLRWDQALAERRMAASGIPLRGRVAALSAGQQAQVALALALAKRPALLVLDEPLASLDPLARREFLQALMAAVADDGITVVFSSHVVAELERVCDHLVVLHAGQVVLADDIGALLADHRLLVGPAVPIDADQLPGVVQATHSDRHTTLVVRTNGTPPAPGWQPHPLALEELVLAYLRRTTTAAARPTANRSEVPA
jgi:ABC-2 type transport system ATP-binding protein